MRSTFPKSSPAHPAGTHIVEVAESHPVRQALLAKLSSLYEVLLAATFVPFLLFFMLAAKRQVWHATMQLFPATQRTEVKETLSDVTQVLRSYVVGTALVGLILVLASWLFFWFMGLDFPFLLALVSGLANLIPYLGVVLSWLPPLLIGLKKFNTPGPFIGMFAMLTFLHFVANNLLVPALVGWRVRLNALALTVSLLLLRISVGRHRAASRDPHHRGDQSDLRPQRTTATRRPLAQRLASAAVFQDTYRWILSMVRPSASASPAS